MILEEITPQELEESESESDDDDKQSKPATDPVVPEQTEDEDDWETVADTVLPEPAVKQVSNKQQTTEETSLRDFLLMENPTLKKIHKEEHHWHSNKPLEAALWQLTKEEYRSPSCSTFPIFLVRHPH